MTTMNEERAGSKAMIEQTSAAQSAPAGEREAFEAWAPVTTALLPNGHDYISPTARLCWETWQAGAAWQRAQVVVPDVSAMAKVLSDRSADACNIDRIDNWAMYWQEYIEDVQAMLARPIQQGEAVEVVAWQDAENPLYTTAERRVMHEWANNQYPIVELMTVAQHQRILADMRQQRDKLARLLREAAGELRTDRHHGLRPKIGAALSELTL